MTAYPVPASRQARDLLALALVVLVVALAALELWR
jgi:hypothetical protein